MDNYTNYCCTISLLLPPHQLIFYDKTTFVENRVHLIGRNKEVVCRFGGSRKWRIEHNRFLSDTDYLLSPSVDDWLTQDHLARAMLDLIDGLDLSNGHLHI